MPRLAWLTDLHLNFVGEEEILQLASEISATEPDAALIGGDVGEASSWEGFLQHLVALLSVPLYFVLGNHDYYGSSLFQVRQRAREITRTAKHLCWLPAAGVISLDSRTALIGHGGWGDARAGKFAQSNVVLNDYYLIAELRAAAAIPPGVQPFLLRDPGSVLNAGLARQLHELGEETADHFRRTVPEALTAHEHVLVLMHVPPFREACWYEGRISDENWAPHFCCLAAGEALKEVMRQHPEKRMTVLCGHTHGGGWAEILPNLEVHTGAAKYGQPAVQSLIDTSDLEEL